MPQITVGTVVKLIILSLIVGLLLHWFDVSPQDLLRKIFGNIDAIAKWSVDAFGSAASYILLGAVIVVPIWAILFALRWMRQAK
ncbi:MAG: DUF6460 domain-containing protein [Proteobacteria bacterium]|nr:DUF6460 domain-containing protein [Pseudomonadota bacterium]